MYFVNVVFSTVSYLLSCQRVLVVYENNFGPGPEVIKLFPCAIRLSTKFILLINVKMATIVEFIPLINVKIPTIVEFILLINVKMPTIVGILIFISMINTTSERPKGKYFFGCRHFSFCEQLKFAHS